VTNIITVEQAENALGVRFPRKVRKELIASQPKSVPKNCLCVPIFPMDLLTLREITVALKERVFYVEEDTWYDDESWAQEIMTPRWYVIYKEAAKDSHSKTFDQQRTLLKKGEEFALAPESLYAMTLNFLVNDERLFQDTYVRTRTKTSGGDLVHFGLFDADGALVDGGRPGGAGSGVGSLFSRSLETLDSDPLELELPETVQVSVQVSVLVDGVEYEGKLSRAS
jgi:hypothetical protein